MAKTKKFSFIAATGLTVYAVVIQRDTGYYLNDADGGFAAAPADKYQEITEDVALGGRYTYDESRTVWADGPYEFVAYSQLGGSPAPTTDTPIASGSFTLVGDSVPTAGSSTISGLCSLADVKTALSFTDTTKDQLCTDIIAAAEKMIQQHTGYTLINTEHTEYFSPGRRHWNVNKNVSADMTALRVKEHPIISVTSVYEDDDRTWDDAADLIAATDYYTDNYNIRLHDDGSTVQFTAGLRTVRAIYRAGYATIPSDLRRAAVMLSVHLYHLADRQRQNIASESLGDATVTYLNEDIPKTVRLMLKPYTRPCGL